MMKNWLIFLFVFSFQFGSLYGQGLKKVIIMYENFVTTTTERVSCNYFEPTFRESIKKIEIKNPTELLILSKYSKSFITVQPFVVNVRASIIFYYTNKTSEYCMDPFGGFVEKRTGRLLRNENLAKYIVKKCKMPN
jgi:hypothetical protein